MPQLRIERRNFTVEFGTYDLSSDWEGQIMRFILRPRRVFSVMTTVLKRRTRVAHPFVRALVKVPHVQLILVNLEELFIGYDCGPEQVSQLVDAIDPIITNHVVNDPRSVTASS